MSLAHSSVAPSFTFMEKGVTVCCAMKMKILCVFPHLSVSSGMWLAEELVVPVSARFSRTGGQGTAREPASLLPGLEVAARRRRLRDRHSPQGWQEPLGREPGLAEGGCQQGSSRGDQSSGKEVTPMAAKHPLELSGYRNI